MIAFFGCQFLLIGTANAQTAPPVGSVVNSYAQVTSISGTSVQVSTSVGFAANSRALIIQMQGATATRTDNASHGDLSTYGSAGRFAYVRIVGVSATTLTLESAPSVSFNTAGAVQIVTVPIFTNASVNGTVIPQAWNGSTGGVVAFDVTGTLTVNANVDATGRGFRGGALAATTLFDSCASDQFNYTGAAQTGTGNKAEGIAILPSAHASRRGHNGNGGGGGNITDAGGGGGGNIGAGGLGGREIDICDDDGAYGGLGGQGLDYSPNNRLFMGGGGGSGSEVSQAPSGGNRAGGGIIMVRVGTLVGNGGQFVSNGLSAFPDDSNGSDGGGAGGAIAVSVISGISGTPVFSVAGGDGGDEANDVFAHGTGGGGGGGAIRLFGSSCGAISPVVSGGDAGFSVLGADVGDPNWGATNGDPGNCLGNFNALGPVTPLASARLNVTKTSSVYSVAPGSSGFSIPGEDMIYTIIVQNVGSGPAGTNSVFVIDQLPSSLTFYNGDIDDGGPDNYPGNDPVAFIDNGSGLSFNYASDVAYSNSTSMPVSFASCTYSPVAGYDPAVTYICINPKGIFATPLPTSEFTLALRARIN